MAYHSSVWQDSLLRFAWTDSRLTWRPEDYENITSLSIPSTHIWSPSLYLANSASQDNSIPMHPARTYALIRSDGAVSIDTSVVHSSFCFLDLTWFPYDQLNCSLSIVSPNIEEGFLTLVPGHFINASPFQNHEWNIDSLATGNITYLTPVQGLAKGVIFTLFLARLPQFYLSSIVLPILLLQVIGISTFWIPLKSGERISACLSVILGLTVFQIVIVDILPQVSREEHRPVIFNHSWSAFVVLVTILLASLITTNISHCAGSIKNSILKTLFFRVLATLVFMRKAGRRKLKHHGNRAQEDSDEVVTYVQHISGQTVKDGNTDRKTDTNESENDAFTDMELIAAILDRLFFIFFAVLQISLAAGIGTLTLADRSLDYNL